MQFTLPTESEVSGELLDVLRRYGTGCSLSDFAIMQGAMQCDQKAEDGLYCGAFGMAENGDEGALVCMGPESRGFYLPGNADYISARPLILPEDVEKIKEHNEIETITLPNGKRIQQVAWGEYPQTVVDDELAAELQEKLDAGELNDTGDVIASPLGSKEIEDLTVFSFRGKRYVQIEARPFDEYNDGWDDSMEEFARKRGLLSDETICHAGSSYWVAVEPIEWLIDDETGSWISKKALFAGVPFGDDERYGEFLDTPIFSFLEKNFKKDVLASVERSVKTVEKGSSKGKDTTAASVKKDAAEKKVTSEELSDIIARVREIDSDKANKILAEALDTTPEEVPGLFDNAMMAKIAMKAIAANKDAVSQLQKIIEEEEARLEAERKAAEEAARLEAERKAAEEAAHLEAERKAAEEAARLEAERKAAEEAAAKKKTKGKKDTKSEEVPVTVIAGTPITSKEEAIEIAKAAKEARIKAAKVRKEIRERTEAPREVSHPDMAVPLAPLDEIRVDESPMSVEEQVDFYVRNGMTFMLHGPSGVGKTARVEAIDPDLTAVPLWNGVLPEDVVGKVRYTDGSVALPNEILDLLPDDELRDLYRPVDENDDGGVWIEPDWYKELCRKCSAEPDKMHVLFIDELTNAKPTTQSLIFHITLKKSITPSKGFLPKNAVVVLAGNSREESGAAYNMPEPLFRRMCGHIHLEANIEDWLVWGSEKNNRYPDDPDRMNIHPLVAAFVAKKGMSVFYTAYDEDEPPEFALDPRSWSQLSDIVYGSKGAIRRELLVSKMGEKLSDDFISFARTPPIEAQDIINGTYSTVTDVPSDEKLKMAMALSFRLVPDKHEGVIRRFIDKELGHKCLKKFDDLRKKDKEKAAREKTVPATAVTRTRSEGR